jgi:hypothetical protein
VIYPKGVDFRSISDLYRRINYTEGLIEIQSFCKREATGPYTQLVASEISISLIEVYLNWKQVTGALTIFREIENETYKAIALLYISRYFLDAGDFDKGRKYLDDAYSILEKAGNIDYDLFLDEFFKVFIRK